MEPISTPSSKAPLISVIVSTFNASRTLQRCIDSFVGQTYPNKEILFADGASKDDTLAILARNKANIAHLISEKDSGIYQAWNRVVPKARGEWIYFLGADDYFWSPDSLERVAQGLAASGSERVVYGQVAIVTSTGEVVERVGSPWEKVAARYRDEMTIPHQGTFHRRDLFADYGLFNENFRICGDYEFLMRELKTRPARFIPNLVVAGMELGGTSSTLSQTRRIIDELKLARELNGITAFSWSIFFRDVRFSLRSGLNRVFGKRLTNVVADIYRVLVGKPRLWTRKDVPK